jgi:hypothetical protein
MTDFGKAWAAEKPTTGSGLNARKTPLLAVNLQLDDVTVGANRKENTVPCGILIITVATLTWCILCCNLVMAISLALLFRLSGVMSQHFSANILYAFLFFPLH